MTDFGPPIPASDLREIRVDVHDVKDFVTLINGETDENLRPYAGQVVVEHGGGPEFAPKLHGLSPAAATGRTTHQESLTEAHDGISSLVRSAEVLLAGISKVISYYGEADVAAQARIADVNAALGAALTEAGLSQPASTQPR